MVGHYLLFLGRYYRSLALIAGNHNLHALLKVRLYNAVPTKPDGPERRFVYYVGKLCATCAAGRPCYSVKIYVAAHLNVLGVYLKYGYPSVKIGQLNRYAPIEPAWPQQRLVKRIWPVCGRQYNNALLRVKAVHFGKQLVERLLALIV